MELDIINSRVLRIYADADRLMSMDLLIAPLYPVSSARAGLRVAEASSLLPSHDISLVV